MRRTCRIATVLTVLAGLWAAGWARADVIYTDPKGALGATDIASVSAVASGPTLTFRVTFHDAITDPSGPGNANNSYGYIDIDADQNPATPAAPLDPNLRGGLAAFGTGVDYYLDLGSVVNHPGSVDVLDSLGALQGAVPISFGADFYEVGVPLGLLGNPGQVYYGVFSVDGTLTLSDFAPKTGAGDPVFGASAVAVDAAEGVPEPGTLLLLGAGGLALAGIHGLKRRAPGARRLRQGAPEYDADGSGVKESAAARPQSTVPK